MVREEDKQAPQRFRRFSGFLGGVRLIFDFLILLLVMLIIGFVVFPMASNVISMRRTRMPMVLPC